MGDRVCAATVIIHRLQVYMLTAKTDAFTKSCLHAALQSHVSMLRQLGSLAAAHLSVGSCQEGSRCCVSMYIEHDYTYAVYTFNVVLRIFFCTTDIGKNNNRTWVLQLRVNTSRHLCSMFQPESGQAGTPTGKHTHMVCQVLVPAPNYAVAGCAKLELMHTMVSTCELCCSWADTKVPTHLGLHMCGNPSVSGAWFLHKEQQRLHVFCTVPAGNFDGLVRLVGCLRVRKLTHVSTESVSCHSMS